MPVKENGMVYYGRGHVQLTWAKNYERMGKIVGEPLFDNPDLALKPEVSADILVEGMLRGRSSKGDFTGKSLEDYFNDSTDDPVGARRIINGVDKAVLIAGYYKNFLDALEHSEDGGQPDDVKQADGEADKPVLIKDKTTLGAVTAIAGSGVLGSLTSINSPWAFAAFFVLAIGAFLFATGRLKIAYKGGV